LLSKRGFADIVVMFSILVILGVLMYDSTVDIDELTNIGEYQNTLLDSYTVAEGSRFYIEKALQLSAVNAMKKLQTCDVSSNEDFQDETEFYFKEYINDFPDENMGFFIVSPFEGSDYTFNEEDGFLYYSAPQSIVVKNCAGSFKECDNIFKIQTTVNAEVKYDLSKACDDYNALSGV